MTETVRILILGDSAADAGIFEGLLVKERPDLEFAFAPDKATFIQALEEFFPDIILADNSLPQFSATDALQIVHQRALHIPFIPFTGPVPQNLAADIIPAVIDRTLMRREMEILARIPMETSHCVFILDKDTGNITWVNEGFTRSTGYTQQDMQGRDLWSILGGPGTDGFTLDYIKSQVESNLPYSCDIQIRTKNGEAKWQLLNGQPLPAEKGKVGKYFVISTDISERLTIEEERIAEKIGRQKEVTRIILQTQELERNKLGNELHDNINQMLASVNLQLGYYLEHPENNTDIVENCRRILQKAIQQARNLSHHMVMPCFPDKSLKEELEFLVENYGYKKITQVDLMKMDENDISPAIKETIYRIAQAQLSNIEKHAGAGKISLTAKNDSHRITMVIQDNGVGFDPQHMHKGDGITSILNRVESYNGTVDIDSRPGKGCTMSVVIPLS